MSAPIAQVNSQRELHDACTKQLDCPAEAHMQGCPAQEQEQTEQPHGQLEIRSASMQAVSFPERMIEMVVMPFETPTVVEHEGRMVTEVVSKGAFNGIQRRRIKANRDHDITKVVGHCVGLYPNRDEGLVAEVRVADTPLGDETLTLASEGLLDASAGFLPMAGGEKWETRSRRRISRAWLGHVAFVAEPAYPGTQVLSVRHADPSVARVQTPRLDQVRAWLLEDQYERLT